MMNVARNHHYVPQGYLAGFTDEGTIDGQLTVFDLVSRKTFRTRPRNVAAQRDFNRVDLKGRTADVLERSLGEFEGMAIAAIRRVQERGGPLTDDELSDIVSLMTLLIARNPKRRRAINTARQHQRRVMLDILGSNKSMYENHLAMAKRDGFVRDDANLPFGKAAALIKSGQCEIGVSSTESLSLELDGIDSIFEMLKSRWWSLVIADSKAPDLVTCDHPVAVVFKDQNRCGPIGYGLPDTEVSFPLGPRHAVIGVLENPLRPQFTASAEQVAALNSRTVWHAARQVYAKSRPALILQRDGIAEFTVVRQRQHQ